MYLSRIELDVQKGDTRRAIVSPQIMHASIENCFPDMEGAKARKLWRLDRLRGKLYLLLLSPDQPVFQKFSKQFCPPDALGEVKDYDVLLSRIEQRQRWRFRLRGNAVHSVSKQRESRGKVYAHVTIEQQRGWLIKKASTCGFALDENAFDVTESDVIRFWRKSEKKPVTLGIAVFEGILEVTDAEQFKNSLTQGIGRAKAYGCGLLTVAEQIR